METIYLQELLGDLHELKNVKCPEWGMVNTRLSVNISAFPIVLQCKVCGYNAFLVPFCTSFNN